MILKKHPIKINPGWTLSSYAAPKEKGERFIYCASHQWYYGKDTCAPERMAYNEGIQALQLHVEKPPEGTGNSCSPDKHEVEGPDMHTGIDHGGQQPAREFAVTAHQVPLQEAPPVDFFTRPCDEQQEEKDGQR
jgi:hypothetical protein